MKTGKVEDSERLTRKFKIDRLLQNSGWKVVSYDQDAPLEKYNGCAVTEYLTKSGPADYVLICDEQPLAILEAKKGSLSAYTVLEQDKRYAKDIESLARFGDYGVPFIYSSNGEKIFFQDLRDPHSYSRVVSKIHTLGALKEMLSQKQEDGTAWLQAHTEMHPRARPYQAEATQSIETGLSKKKRKMLIAMATGTGKTFTMAMQVYRLMKSGYAKRILFLVDRRALAAQAVREFTTFEPEPGLKFDKIYEVYSQRFKREDFDDEKFNPSVLPTNYLTNPKAGQAFVYVCTIQRMRINLFGREGAFEEEGGDFSDEGEMEKLDIPIHAFDLVIADECHRGYTAMEMSKWREVLDYFDAVKIGLTATPAAHTSAYFGEPVFRYDYSRAVKEGYLVDYDLISIKSKVRLDGIFLKENELVGVIDSESGIESLDKVEDERGYDSAKLERQVTSPDSTQRIFEEYSKYALEHERLLGRFPKTLIFAVNDIPHISHCDRVVKTCREIFGRGDSFVQKITGSPTVDRPLQKIREFRNRPEPAIVVTVDMLSTGIDVPAIEHIIFLRPVKSRILFAQMLGRGTRRCNEINKDRFVVFDCFGGSLFDYFSKATDFTAEPPEKPARTIEDVINDIYKNKDRKYNVNCLVKRFQRMAKNMSGEAIEQFEEFVPDGDISRFAQELPGRIDNDFVNTIKLLRDPEFQELLKNYPRASKVFVVAYETKDEVSSGYMFKNAEGKEFKAIDYIEAFARFVKENPDQIQAIKILLDRPSDWSTEALHELRAKLRKSQYKFTEDKLQKAYHYELADIISMVKHAARNEPLMSARERVEKAVSRMMGNQELNEEQKKWLNLIKEHLVVNLAIEKRDFELMPVFARQGGWKRADKVFAGKMNGLIGRLNEEVAR